MHKMSKEMLKSSYRKAMWKSASGIMRDIGRIFDISEAYVIGSFTTKKRRPADVDVVVLLKLKGKKYDGQWSLDLCFVPDNKFGRLVLEDADLWMKQKYGKKNYRVIRIK